MSDVNLMHFLTGEHGNNSVLEMEWRQKRISTTVPSFKSLLSLLGRHLHEEPEESGVKSLNASGCQDRNFQSPRLAHRFIHDMGCRVIKCWTHLSNLRSNDLSMLQKIRSGHNCAQEITSAHIRETMPLQRDNAEGCPIWKWKHLSAICLTIIFLSVTIFQKKKLRIKDPSSNLARFLYTIK